MKTQSSTTQAGFGHIAILALVLVVTAIGLMGYKVYGSSSTTRSDSTLSTQQSTPKAAATSRIKNANDIDTAAKALDQNDPTATSNQDLADLDIQTAGLN